jgi:lipopolysaccharide/colanic/teichoic acid biosynthesis glycosyltransferase
VAKFFVDARPEKQRAMLDRPPLETADVIADGMPVAVAPSIQRRSVPDACRRQVQSLGGDERVVNAAVVAEPPDRRVGPLQGLSVARAANPDGRVRGGIHSTATVSDDEVIELPKLLKEAAVPAPGGLRRPEGPRRAVNVLAAALGLIVTGPLMLLIGLLIKLSSPGPIFFMQTRVGIDLRNPGKAVGNGRRRTDVGGRPFTIYKFRTMAAASGQAQTWAQPNDPRVTALGRVLRKFRLDELPQFVNVLAGDMNLVGPRPEQPRIFSDLREQIPGYRWRQRVRPGITGRAQVNLGYDSSLENVRRKVAYDLEYVQRQSVVEDLCIMACTIPVMVFGRGAW